MSRGASSDIQRFGEKLHLLRTRRGLTLKELAIALGYKAHGHISELEAGKKVPTVGFVISVARFFGVSTDELLMDELELRSSPGEHS
ncbi:MAG: helix-turn-helix domain-containing protein [Nitrososphaera sp.]|nr:helix-turn-helix domain-containing protein [Nitrososphaera sp.]